MDKTRLQDLDEAVRRYLAWHSIVAERRRGAQTISAPSDSGRRRGRRRPTVPWRRGFPRHTSGSSFLCRALRRHRSNGNRFASPGQDALAVRASKRLRNDELLVTSLAASRLRMEMDRVPLWRGNHVAVKQLVEDFARYLYMPRAKETVRRPRRDPRRAWPAYPGSKTHSPSLTATTDRQLDIAVCRPGVRSRSWMRTLPDCWSSPM